MEYNSTHSNLPSLQTSKYDVFISFRGEDTRTKFTDHLVKALQRKGVFVFKDDNKLKKGKAISPELFKAIEESRISIIIFSRNYAGSTWCLEEMTKIADCNEKFEHTVLPVFYDVDPSDVRKQTGVYEKVFAQHEEGFSEKVGKWRASIKRLANLSGWDVRNKSESTKIEEIVEEVTNKLGHVLSVLTDDLVGIESRVKTLDKHLALDMDDVRFVGICGMGGIGKTTLSAAVYHRISHKFQAHSFIRDVSKISRDSGLICAQEKLLCETLENENLKIRDLVEGTNWIKNRLRHLKVLIVLDNVDHSDQLENLVGKPSWFGAGSRIIVTSRNEHILKQHGVYEVYRAKELSEGEALKLLCRKAFKNDKPSEDYMKLTKRVLQYVKGLPLAVKVLGSFLFDRNLSEWTSALDRLQESLEPEIKDVLRTSFDGLVESEKDIFLDIACFFNKEKEEDVKNILKICGFYPEIGMRSLIDKSLISIQGQRIWMHDLLQEFGRNIIREKHPKKRGKWSRLWLYEDFCHVITENTGANDVEAIVVDLKDKTKTSLLNAEALSKMRHLRLLILNDGEYFSGNFNCFPNQLKYLSWHMYPFNYSPFNAHQPDNLVELHMPHSNVTQLWEGAKCFQNLRSIDLSYSKNLVDTPDFSEVPNLEQLDLENCTKLSKFNPSIACLKKLAFLNLKGCKNLVSTPDCIWGLTSLDTLSLYGCSKLQNLLETTSHAKGLDISETAEQSKCSSERHQGSIGLPLASLADLASSLKNLDISFCHVRKVPDSVGCLYCLEALLLDGNDFITLPSTIKNLYKLRLFCLEHCKNLVSLPELPLRIGSSEGKNYLPKKRGGFYIFNCPKLVEMESYNSLALSWLIKLIQDPNAPETESRLDSVVPGSEIPRWFNHRSSELSIRIKLPPDVHDRHSNLLGLALCVTFGVRDPHPPECGDGCMENRLQFYLNQAYWFYLRMRVENEPVTVDLDHLWLCYLSRKRFSDSQWFIEKEFLDVKFEADPGLEMRKCGFRWVYVEDVDSLKNQQIVTEVNLEKPWELRISMDGPKGVVDPKGKGLADPKD